MKVNLILSLLLTSPLLAQDGKQLYQIHCSACHGAVGEGRKGAAPALSQSSWVNGDPNIITRILLHGMQGVITIHGESYELAMPAQSLLDDQQIADVSTYVRSQWGNKAEPITKEFVQETRETTKNQSGLINTRHLSKPYNLKDHTLKLTDLLSSTFSYTTDFDSLANKTPKAIEEEKGNFISPLQAGSANESFTAQWTGKLTIKHAGNYDFSLGTNDAARISVNGKAILNRTAGTEPSVGTVKLKKGEADVEILYSHQAKTPTFFRLFLSGPKMNMHRMHDSGKKKKAPPIIINPTAQRALVHRNFLVKGGERTLAVGFPENINFYFSTEHMRLSKVWQGDFLEVGPTWIGRARGKTAKPLGKTLPVVEKGEVFKQFSNSPKKWNDKKARSVERQFKSYSFDQDGTPIFTYLVGGYQFSDHYTTSQDSKKLTRKITIKPNNNASKGLHWKLLDNVNSANKNSHVTEQGITLEITSPDTKPILIGKDLILPISKPTTITLDYVWK